MRWLWLLFLLGCQGAQNPLTSGVAKAMPTPPKAENAVAWSLFPLSLSGGLAILAGVVAMIWFPGPSGRRALVVGIIISLVPPIFLALEHSLLVPVSIATVVVGGGMLVFYLARSWERQRHGQGVSK
jgi:hypothetical protein|tara:strand:- start:1268 stop:1648 length:381 start_codon:yes stop_codon:yes gene_type:complete